MITQKLTVKSIVVFMKTSGFHEKVLQFSLKKQRFSLGNLINQLIQDKSFSFIVCLGKAMSDDSMKTAAFHENCSFSVKTCRFSSYTWWSPKSSQWKALRFSWKPAVFMKSVAVFTEKWQFSLGNLINQLIQDKSFSFIVCLGKAMSDDSMKIATFQWKPPLFMKTARKTTNCQEW